MPSSIREPVGWTAVVTLASVLVAYGGAFRLVRVAGEGVLLAVLLLAMLVIAARPGATPLDRVEFPIRLTVASLGVAIAAHLDASSLVFYLGFRSDAYPVAMFMCEIVPIAFFIAGAGGALLAPRIGVRHRAIVRGAAWMAAGLACAALAIATARAGRPTASNYVAGLRVLGSVDAPPKDAPEGARTVTTLEDVQVTRTNLGRDRNDCYLWMAPRSSSSSPPDMPQRWARIRYASYCGRMIVNADDAHHAWVVETEHGELAAYDARDWEEYPRPLPPERLLHALRPPIASWLLAALGVVVALAALLRRPRSALPTDDALCRKGFIDDDGTLTCTDGGPPLTGPLPGPAPVGLVVAVLAPPGESFRTHAGPVIARLLPGTLAEHRRAELAAPVFALAFVALAAMPLAVMLLDFG